MRAYFDLSGRHYYLNQRLIIPPSYDPDSGTNWATLKTFRLLVLRVTALIVVVVTPFFASGGAFSTFTAWLVGGGDVSAQETPTKPVYTLQTLPLLEAPRNPEAPSFDYGGGDIHIVGGALLAQSGPLGTTAGVVKPKSDQISVHVVNEDDTLSEIADMYGVSVNTIFWANDIEDPSTIQPGDKLVILPVTGVRYTIKRGGTVEDVAELFDADANEVALFNGIDVSEPLAAGTEIIVPGGEVSTPKPASPAPSASRSRIAQSGGPTYAGYYMRPIRGGTRSQGVHGYNGVDLATYAGAEIYAAAAGTVIISKSGGWNGGYGNYVVIRHDNGTQTLYAHNSSNIVSVGQSVVQGQVVGYVGNTGRSTGNHVHFEVRGAQNPF